MENNRFAIAVKCVIHNGKDILLLRKTKKEMIGDASNNSWDLPGGRIQYKETVSQAVEREIREEVALHIETMQIKSAATVIRPDGTHLVILLHSCLSNERNVSLSKEHEMYKCFKQEELLSDTSIPEWIKDSVEKCI